MTIEYTPKPNELYISVGIKNSYDKQEFIQEFDYRQWYSRKNSWTDYDLVCSWAELEVEGDGEILINGCIHPGKFDEFINFLIELDYHFIAELYDRENKLLEERKYGETNPK